jgi:sporulation protein YlmC with PRC-barrel domain
MKRKLILALAATAAFVAWSSAEAADKLGKIESAKKLIGREIQTAQGQKAGEVKDFVVDLESGRVLYGIISAGGFLGIGDELTVVPPAAFTSSTDARLIISADKEKLTSAPRFTKDREAKLADTQFTKQIHQHFGQSLGWEGSFNLVHKASELIGMNVKNVSDQNVGDINDLGIDMTSGRVTYVILGAGGVLGAGEKNYVMPPNAFTLASDNKSLVTSIDKEKLANAPELRNNNWQQISDASFAGRVYQHYGKQPYWSGSATLTPTGRDESRVYQDQPKETTPQPRPRSGGLRVRGNEQEAEASARARTPRAGGAFADVEEAKRLIGMDVQNARGVTLGKLNDMVVDLEAGRVIYAVVDLSGRGGAKAIAPQSLSLSADDKSVRFLGDQSKLNAAPAFDAKAEVNNAQFAANVYAHFNQQHDWFTASRNFNNSHKASELMSAKVQNVQNQSVGQVQNLMVDLPNGRVLYVILSAAPIVGRGGDNLFAMPPNAFTVSSDNKTLVSDVDKAKLEGAPRFNRANLRELANPAKAAEIYRYYGKQAYWSSGELAPTGRERGRPD